MLKGLPTSLIQASQRVIETEDVVEDVLSAETVPGEDKSEEQLSGETEEVVINPEYKTSTYRRPI